jgi:LPPG:FO 2-phospho-L-lactate transferase
MLVTALAGGVGAAKLLIGLDRHASSLTAIVNTGDDAEIYGVRISPDIDIVTYWLAGKADTQRGWGIAGDTFTVVDSIAQLGDEAWFRLGDRDFATCILRTGLLKEGRSLSEATDTIRRAHGVEARLLPMSDDDVRTHVVTSEGEVLSFQEYFVKLRTEPDVVEVRYEGIETARPGPNVVESIEQARVVVVCPSNPVLSIAPILGVAGVKKALQAHPRVVAVSPIVGGRALKGPADRLLVSLGGDSSASGAARYYAEFCDLFVVDSADADEVAKVEALGVPAVALDTIMSDSEASARLAAEVLEAAENVT